MAAPAPAPSSLNTVRAVRQRVAADGDCTEAAMDLIKAAAERAQKLALKCRNMGFAVANLPEPDNDVRQPLERLGICEAMQLALVGTNHRTFQNLALNYMTPSSGNRLDKGGETLLHKILTQLQPNDNWEWDRDGTDQNHPLIQNLKAVDPLKAEHVRQLNAFLEHANQLHQQRSLRFLRL